MGRVRKLGRGHGTNQKAYRWWCEWCGVRFACARPDALTCGNAHRLRWTRWARKWAAIYGRRPRCGPRGDTVRQISPVHAAPEEQPQSESRLTR